MRKFHLLLTSCLTVAAPAAYAQDAAAPAVTTAAAAAEDGIGDIVVTARRRSESVQAVPLSVTAIPDAVLREKQILTPYDLVQSTPGISATAGSSSRNDVQYFIRGQGATFGSSPSVVTYFADVPQPTNGLTGGANITFYDLQSVQVLKGPQGTLFGRSTTGGAVLLTPRAPSGEFDGFAEMSLGNYAAKEFTGAINLPILDDRVALRIAGNYSYHKGFARSLTTGEDLDDRDRSSFRISLLVRPTDWLKNTVIFTDVDINENGTAGVLGNYNPQGIARLVSDPSLPFSPRFNGNTVLTGSLLDTTPGGIGVGGLGFVQVSGLCGQVAARLNQTVAQCVAQRVAIIDQVRNGLNTEFARLQAGGSRRRVPTTYDNRIQMHSQQVVNTTELDFGELSFLGETSFKNILSTTKLLSSSAVREIQGGVGTGITITGLDFVNGQFVDKGWGRNNWFDVWSEEAQLSGSFNGKHDWIVGYFTEQNNRTAQQNNPQLFTTLNGALTVPAGLPAAGVGYFDPFKSSQTGYFAQTTIDFADFGLDNLKLTAGYRHSIVRSRLSTLAATLTPTGTIPTPGAVFIDSPKLKQSADSYTFALDYRIDSRTLVYVTTRRGFKQGGINVASIVPAANGLTSAVPVFGPEKVTDYEAGIKADYEVAGIAGRTNLALFTSKFKGLQRAGSFFNGTTTANQIVNAAGLRSRGVEIEQTWRFTPEFEANIAYAYLDAKFTSFPGVIVRPADGAILQRINSPVTGTPKHHLDVAARYTVPLDDKGDLVFAGNVSYQSRVLLSDDGLYTFGAQEAQKAYATMNARIDWRSVMGNSVDLSFYAKNLTNKLYRIGAGNLISAGLGTTTYIYGDPRTYGVQLRVRFGTSADR